VRLRDGYEALAEQNDQSPEGSSCLQRDGDDTLARLRTNIAPELRTALQENKDRVLRYSLLRDALAYVAQFYDGGALPNRLKPLEHEVNEAYAEGSLEDMTLALRRYTRAAGSHSKPGRGEWPERGVVPLPLTASRQSRRPRCRVPGRGRDVGRP
jgi:hypothetical protein